MPSQRLPVARKGDQEDGIRSVRRATAILKAFVAARDSLTLSQVASSLGLSVSTAHRLLRTLEQEGLLQRHPVTGRYRLAPAYEPVSSFMSVRRDLIAESEPWMLQLSQAVGEDVCLGVLRDTQVVYLSKVRGAHLLHLSMDPGMAMPLHCTAPGKVLLAYLPPHLLQQLAQSLELTRYTPSTRVTWAALHRDLEEVRASGTAIDDEEYVAGVRCVAAPVQDALGNVVAAITTGGPSSRFTYQRLATLRAAFASTAVAISRSLGFAGVSLRAG